MKNQNNFGKTNDQNKSQNQIQSQTIDIDSVNKVTLKGNMSHRVSQSITKPYKGYSREIKGIQSVDLLPKTGFNYQFKEDY